MDKAGVVEPKAGKIAQDQNIKDLVYHGKAFELYLKGNREALEVLSSRVTQSDLGVNLMLCLSIDCLSAPNSTCPAFSAKTELGPLSISPLPDSIMLSFVSRGRWRETGGGRSFS